MLLLGQLWASELYLGSVHSCDSYNRGARQKYLDLQTVGGLKVHPTYQFLKRVWVLVLGGSGELTTGSITAIIT